MPLMTTQFGICAATARTTVLKTSWGIRDISCTMPSAPPICS
jgi:hypothetical protein